MTNEETLAKACKTLCLQEPYYGLFFMSLNKIWDPNFKPFGTGTLGVGLQGINYYLKIEPEFWSKQQPIKQLGLIKHEVLHLIFFHLTDYEHFVNKRIANVAFDIEVNQYIKRDWLPENGCFLENFPELEGKEKMGSRWYYEKLMESRDIPESTIHLICTSGDEERNGDGNSITLPDGTVIETPQHDWKNVSELNETTKKLIDTQVTHLLNEIADIVEKSRGTVPEEIRDLLIKLNTIEPPKFDWKGYVRRFTGRAVKTYTKKSSRKLNLRFPDNPGLKIHKQKHILLVVDTSGSVSNEELKEFLNEMYHIKSLGSEVTLIQCDTRITSIAPLNQTDSVEIHGRGGTSFQEPIDYYSENLNRYSCLIYFTDGEAPAPENPRGNILWVLSERSQMNNDLPGEVIKLEL